MKNQQVLLQNIGSTRTIWLNPREDIPNTVSGVYTSNHFKIMLCSACGECVDSDWGPCQYRSLNTCDAGSIYDYASVSTNNCITCGTAPADHKVSSEFNRTYDQTKVKVEMEITTQTIGGKTARNIPTGKVNIYIDGSLDDTFNIFE